MKPWKPSRGVWMFICVVLGVGIVGGLLGTLYDCADIEKGICKTINERPPWTLVIALGTAPAAIATWFWRVTGRKQELDQAQQRLYSERFVSSIELLANNDLHSQLGGIFALGQLAQDAPGLAQQIANVLVTFAKDIAGKAESVSGLRAIPPTVIEAVRVLGSGALQVERRDIGGIRLGNASLASTNLAGAYLQNTKLIGAELIGANLQGADLQGANLREANLQYANLEGADLRFAHLEGAHLEGADLRFAHLRFAEYDSKTQFPDGFDPTKAGMLIKRKKAPSEEGAE